MNKPSAKTDFSNDNLGKVMTTLIKKGHKVEFDRNTLSVYGDLKTDIDGLKCNLNVLDGDLLSNVTIGGELRVANANNKNSKIILNDTVIHALSVIAEGDVSSIQGNGKIKTNRSISANLIDGYEGLLDLETQSIHSSGVITGIVNVHATGMISGKKIQGNRVKLVTNSLDASEITLGASAISGRTDLSVISDGAIIFSYGELRCQVFGGLGNDEAPIMVVANNGFKEKQFRMGDIYAHNAILFSPDKQVFDDVEIMRIGDSPRKTILTDNFDDLPEEMIDFIRLGYSTMQKHFDTSMPEHVSNEIHRRFAPA